jgi:predicted metalloprotease
MAKVIPGMNRFLTTAILLAALLFGGAATAADDFTIRLAEFEFDPLLQEPALPHGWDRSVRVSHDLHLVQFDGPIQDEALERLRQNGLEPVQYIYPNTYIAWGRSTDREVARRDRAVRWAGDFAPAYRVQPQWRDRREETLEVNVLIYRGAGADGVVEALSKLAGDPAGRLTVSEKFELASFELPGELIQAAASIPGVYSIQERSKDWTSRAEVAAQINVDNVDGSNVAFPGYQSWLTTVGLDGTGVVIAGVDEGADEDHPDLLASIAPCTGTSCSFMINPHGTHTAGILVGDGSSTILDANGFLRGLGVAPGADLVAQVYAAYLLQPGGAYHLMTDSQRNGAVVSNNSWGISGIPKGYDLDTLLVDVGVRDADPDWPGNQPLIYVQAIENGDGGTSTQGAPDEAKNIIAVGSTWAIEKFTDDPSPDINDVSENSAHGPALDGRTLPHIVAPGCRVDSTYPDFGEGPEHHPACGTSMAAPQVTGALALFFEYYRALPDYTDDPSPALAKAVLLPIAHDLAGNNDADGAVMGHRPDSKQGWGRLNLPALIDPPAGSVIYFDQGRVFEESGESWVREVTPVDPGQPMRIMLAWTDAPGHGLGGSTPAWNNDLDLVIEAGGNTYLGNDFDTDGWSKTGGVADAMNNAEAVFLQTPPTEVTIKVMATNINSNGVPSFNDETDQDFALVCYNCAYTAGFDLNVDPVTQYVCAPDKATPTVEVEQHLGYSEPVTLTLSGLPPGASASPDRNPVPPGATALLVIFPGTAASGDYELQLDGDSIDMSRTHPVYYRLRTAVPPPANLTLPVNGGMDVAPSPTLEWDTLTWASHYVVEISADPAFQTVFYSGYSSGPSHTVKINLAQETLYYWRVRAGNVCGIGDFSPVHSFTTRNVPDVLLVDDDYDYYGDFQSDYTDALTNLGVSYDIWDVYGAMMHQEPRYSDLADYKKVIWWSGKEENYAGPKDLSEYELVQWFERRSGCLLITSSDYLLVRGYSDFMQQQLGVSTYTEDIEMGEVTGQGTVFGTLGTITLRNTNPDYSDVISPDGTAELAFSSDMGDAGVNKDGAFYRTAFMGYGLERLFTSTDLENALSAFLGWCDGLATIDGDSDGVLNGTDCAPGDAGAWTAPSPITDLRLSKGSSDEFSWSQPVSGSGVVYDLLRSSDTTDWWNATCLASGVEQPVVPAGWAPDPLPGESQFYLVRARGECGTTMLGNDFYGTPRGGTACKPSWSGSYLPGGGN